jgi:urease accessory protein
MVGTGLAVGAFAPLALPAVEPLLAASVLVAGLMGLGSARLPAILGLGLAGAFSVVHGNAHGQEMAVADLAAAAGAISMSMGLMAIGWLAGRHARLQKLAPALVTLAGAGMLGFA